MSCNNNYSTNKSGCEQKNGCYPNICPDFTIKRHDTKPPFKVEVSDCDGPLDLTGLVLEASMWAKAKLKTTIVASDTFIGVADNIGFEQIMEGDIIVFDRARLPERMAVISFDENDKLIEVERGYQGTTPQTWKKGEKFKIMKFMDAVAETQMIYEDVEEVDGEISPHQLQQSYLVYNWQPGDTCLAGCYYLEFKLLKLTDSLDDDDDDYPEDCEISLTPPSFTPSYIPSFTPPSLTPVSFTPTDFGCKLGTGVEWVRRFPLKDGFIIQVFDSPTAEL